MEKHRISLRADIIDAAAENGHADIVEYFAKKHMFPNADAIRIAYERKHYDVLKVLDQYGVLTFSMKD